MSFLTKFVVSFYNTKTKHQFLEVHFAENELIAAVICVANEADIELEDRDRSEYELYDFIEEMRWDHNCVVQVLQISN